VNLTLLNLLNFGLTPTIAKQFLAPLNDACARYEITTPYRVAGFMGQCMVESQNFTTLEENLNYRTPEVLLRVFPSRVHGIADARALVAAGPKAIANRVYAKKNGNGDESTGDGWKYRGRGVIQLTGRNNYTRATTDLMVDYVNTPDLVALPQDACISAAWYWRRAACNEFADAMDWDRCTRAVNGAGMLHREKRAELSQHVLKVLLG
jgi:putative chitinase